MRIIGGHDYYDTALSFGHDSHIVFVRESNRCVTDREVDCPLGSVKLTLTDGRRAQSHLVLGVRGDGFQVRRQRYVVRRITVIFCGKIHHGVSISRQNELRLGELRVTHYWQVERFTEWLTEALGLTIGRRSDAVDRLFGTEMVSSALLDWLITNKVIVAVRVAPENFVAANHPTWEINADRLGEVEFYRKLHAFEAFQEIEMWIGGVLPGESTDMTEVDDATRIAKHGFDKMSFRRAKS